jgi:Tfp pilus assembly protein PilF
MPKLYLEQKKLNPADELRESLSSLEDQLVELKGMDSGQAAAFLDELDRSYLLMARLEAAGLNVLAVQGRFKGIQARLERKAARLLKALGGAAVLKEARPEPAPPRQEQWWWYIDEGVTAHKKQVRRRLAAMLLVAALIVGGLVLVFNTVLAPSPEVLARVEAENKAFNALDAGEFPQALAAIEEGLGQAPDDPGLWLVKGALHQLLDQEAEAEESFARAQALLNDPIAYHIGRGQLALRFNRPEGAEREARAALEIDENTARAWLLLAQALEGQDRRMQALLAYEKAGDQALEAGDNEVYVIARLGLARLSSFQ